MGSTLVETININAKDFTEHFLTCSTCINQYSSDSHEHQPKLLPCSHTVCRQCLERIVSSQPRSDAIKCMLIHNHIFLVFLHLILSRSYLSRTYFITSR
jgi:tripartite motif-containing protein 2/3